MNHISPTAGIAVKAALGQMLGIVALASLLGLSVNALRSDGLRLTSLNFSSPQCGEEIPGTHSISARAALGLINDPDTVFVDVRPSSAFQEGHIEGSMSLPYSLLEPYGEKDLEPLRRKKRDQYDEKAKAASSELLSSSVKGVVVLEGGFASWLEAGGPISKHGNTTQ